MRNIIGKSLNKCKHHSESDTGQTRSNVYTGQVADSIIKRDFDEVWYNIEESIRTFELTHGTKKDIKIC